MVMQQLFRQLQALFVIYLIVLQPVAAYSASNGGPSRKGYLANPYPDLRFATDGTHLLVVKNSDDVTRWEFVDGPKNLNSLGPQHVRGKYYYAGTLKVYFKKDYRNCKLGEMIVNKEKGKVTCYGVYPVFINTRKMKVKLRAGERRQLLPSYYTYGLYNYGNAGLPSGYTVPEAVITTGVTTALNDPPHITFTISDNGVDTVQSTTGARVHGLPQTPTGVTYPDGFTEPENGLKTLYVYDVAQKGRYFTQRYLIANIQEGTDGQEGRATFISLQSGKPWTLTTNGKLVATNPTTQSSTTPATSTTASTSSSSLEAQIWNALLSTKPAFSYDARGELSLTNKETLEKEIHSSLTGVQEPFFVTVTLTFENGQNLLTVRVNKFLQLLSPADSISFGLQINPDSSSCVIQRLQEGPQTLLCTITPGSKSTTPVATETQMEADITISLGDYGTSTTTRPASQGASSALTGSVIADIRAGACLPGFDCQVTVTFQKKREDVRLPELCYLKMTNNGNILTQLSTVFPCDEAAAAGSSGSIVFRSADLDSADGMSKYCFSLVLPQEITGNPKIEVGFIPPDQTTAISDQDPLSDVLVGAVALKSKDLLSITLASADQSPLLKSLFSEPPKLDTRQGETLQDLAPSQFEEALAFLGLVSPFNLGQQRLLSSMVDCYGANKCDNHSLAKPALQGIKFRQKEETKDGVVRLYEELEFEPSFLENLAQMSGKLRELSIVSDGNEYTFPIKSGEKPITLRTWFTLNEEKKFDPGKHDLRLVNADGAMRVASLPFCFEGAASQFKSFTITGAKSFVKQQKTDDLYTYYFFARVKEASGVMKVCNNHYYELDVLPPSEPPFTGIITKGNLGETGQLLASSGIEFTTTWSLKRDTRDWQRFGAQLIGASLLERVESTKDAVSVPFMGELYLGDENPSSSAMRKVIDHTVAKSLTTVFQESLRQLKNKGVTLFYVDGGHFQAVSEAACDDDGCYLKLAGGRKVTQVPLGRLYFGTPTSSRSAGESKSSSNKVPAYVSLSSLLPDCQKTLPKVPTACVATATMVKMGIIRVSAGLLPSASSSILKAGGVSLSRLVSVGKGGPVIAELTQKSLLELLAEKFGKPSVVKDKSVKVLDENIENIIREKALCRKQQLDLLFSAEKDLLQSLQNANHREIADFLAKELPQQLPTKLQHDILVRDASWMEQNTKSALTQIKGILEDPDASPELKTLAKRYQKMLKKLPRWREAQLKTFLRGDPLIEELSAKIKQHETLIKKLEKQESSGEVQTREVQTKLKDAKTTLEELQTEKQARVEQLVRNRESAASELVTELQKRANAYQQLQEEIVKLEKELVEMKKNGGEATRIKEKEKALAKAQQQLREAAARVKNIGQPRIIERLGELETQIAEKESRIQNFLSAESEIHPRSGLSFERRMGQIDTLFELRKELDALKAERAALRESLSWMRKLGMRLGETASRVGETVGGAWKGAKGKAAAKLEPVTEWTSRTLRRVAETRIIRGAGRVVGAAKETRVWRFLAKERLKGSWVSKGVAHAADIVMSAAFILGTIMLLQDQKVAVLSVTYPKLNSGFYLVIPSALKIETNGKGEMEVTSDVVDVDDFEFLRIFGDDITYTTEKIEGDIEFFSSDTYSIDLHREDSRWYVRNVQGSFGRISVHKVGDNSHVISILLNVFIPGNINKVWFAEGDLQRQVQQMVTARAVPNQEARFKAMKEKEEASSIGCKDYYYDENNKKICIGSSIDISPLPTGDVVAAPTGRVIDTVQHLTKPPLKEFNLLRGEDDYLKNLDLPPTSREAYQRIVSCLQPAPKTYSSCLASVDACVDPVVEDFMRAKTSQALSSWDANALDTAEYDVLSLATKLSAGCDYWAKQGVLKRDNWVVLETTKDAPAFPGLIAARAGGSSVASSGGSSLKVQFCPETFKEFTPQPGKESEVHKGESCSCGECLSWADALYTKADRASPDALCAIFNEDAFCKRASQLASRGLMDMRASKFQEFARSCFDEMRSQCSVSTPVKSAPQPATQGSCCLMVDSSLKSSSALHGYASTCQAITDVGSCSKTSWNSHTLVASCNWCKNGCNEANGGIGCATT